MICCQKFVGLYICLFSKQLLCIFINKLLKTFQKLHSFHLHRQMQILDAPCPEVQKDAINMSSSYGSPSCTTLLVSDSLPVSSSLVSNKKSSDSSELTSLSSYLSKMLEISSSVLLLDAAIFIALDHGVYSVSINCHGGHWLQRRRPLVVPHRGKTVDYLTVLIPKSYLVIPGRC
jgi:hypothetical protein